MTEHTLWPSEVKEELNTPLWRILKALENEEDGMEIRIVKGNETWLFSIKNEGAVPGDKSHE